MENQMFKRIILFLLIIAVSTVLSQEIKFDTHSLILKGELTEDDVFEKDFGRFDAYELPLEEGDILQMRLNASFFPLMIISAPSSEYKMAFPENNNSEVTYKQEIDETGLWYIYIAGDSSDSGDHNLELCYVSRDTKEIPLDADFRILVNFFLAHSATDFFYLKDNDCRIKSGEWDVELDSYEKYNSATIVTKNDISVLSVYFDSEGDLFEELTSILKINFKKAWNVRVNDSNDLVELFEIEGLRKMTLVRGEEEIELKISTK